MRSKRLLFYRQFLALFTILSLTFTQAFPAFALHGQEPVENRTAPQIRAGLEELPSRVSASNPGSTQVSSNLSLDLTLDEGPKVPGMAWVPEQDALNNLRQEIGTGWAQSLLNWSTIPSLARSKKTEELALYVWFLTIYRDRAYQTLHGDRQAVETAVREVLTNKFKFLSVTEQLQVLERIFHIDEVLYPQARMLAAAERYQPEAMASLRSGGGTAGSRIALLRKAIGWTLLVEQDPSWLGNESLWMSLMVQIVVPKEPKLAQAVQEDVNTLTGQCMNCGIQALRHYPAPESEDFPRSGPEAAPEFFMAALVGAIDVVYNRELPAAAGYQAVKTLRAHPFHGHADRNRFATSAYALAKYQGLTGSRLLAEGNELLDLLAPIASKASPILMETVDPMDSSLGASHAVVVVKVDAENVVFIDNDQLGTLPRNVFVGRYHPTGVALLNSTQINQIKPEYRVEISEKEMKSKLWACGIVWFIGDFNGLQVVLDALKTLFYRAPDASGISKILSQTVRQMNNGKLDKLQEQVTRRVIGAAANLYYYLTGNPVFKDGTTPEAAQAAWALLAQKEGLVSQQGRDLSTGAGYTLGSLYGYEQGGKPAAGTALPSGIQIGDYGAASAEIPFTFDPVFSMLKELMVQHGVPLEIIKQVLRRALIASLRRTLTWEDKFVLDEEQRRDHYLKETTILREVVDRLLTGTPLSEGEIRALSERSETDGGEPLAPYGGLPDGFSTPKGRVDLSKVGFQPLGVVAEPLTEEYKWERAEEAQAREAAWRELGVQIGEEVDFKYIPKRIVKDDGKKYARIDVNFGYGTRLFGDIRLARGVTIGRGAELRDTSAGSNTQIGDRALVERCVIGPRAKLRQQVHVHDSTVGMGAEITGSTTQIRDSILGNGAYVDNSVIDHYEIGRNARIIQSHLTMHSPEGERIGFFGMRDRRKGDPIAPNVAIEIGGMQVWIYPGMTLAEAVKLAQNRLDGRLQELYRQKLEEFEVDLKAQRTTDKGVLGAVGEGTYMNGAKEVRGVLIGSYAVIDNPGVLVNTTILSDQDEPAYVGFGGSIIDSIIQWGAKVSTNAVVERSILLEAAKATHGQVVMESIVGYNSEFEKGELTASMVGANTASHHANTMIIGAFIPEHGVNFGAGVSYGSNHPGRQADQSGSLGRGSFMGLQTAQQFPATYAMFSFIGFGTRNLEGKMDLPFTTIRLSDRNYPGNVSSEVLRIPGAGQTVEALGGKVALTGVADGTVQVDCFPVENKLARQNGSSYALSEKLAVPEIAQTVSVNRTGGGVWVVRITDQLIAVHYRHPEISPSLNRIQPAGILAEPYKLKRDQRKWQTRFAATRPTYNFEIFQPDSVDEMIRARDLLAKEPEVVREVYTDKDENGRYHDVIGKNFMTEEDRRLAVINYTAYIKLYALTGLKFRLAEILKTGGIKNFEDLMRRLAEPPVEGSRWEHERKVLEQEMGKSLNDITSDDLKSWLEQAAKIKTTEYDLVYKARDKDWGRGVRVTARYQETHGAVPGSESFKRYMWWFDKLFDFKFGTARDPEVQRILNSGTSGEQEVGKRWTQIAALLKDAEYKIPPDFNDDLIRDTFRKIDTELLATIATKPQYAEEVEADFKVLVQKRGGDPQLTWLEAWTLEAKANRIGLAYTAVVGWFQKKAVAAGIIPQELVEDGTIKIGVMDRLTAQLLPDDDLAHGRWATIALNTLFAAQPVPGPDGTRVVALNGDVGRGVNGERREALSKKYEFTSGNDTETIAVQLHDNAETAARGNLETTLRSEWPADEAAKQEAFLRRMDANQIKDPEERAARLAAFQLSPGTSWAVAVSTIHNLPRARYGWSSDRPISLIRLPGSPNVLVASDPVAALGWFPEEIRTVAMRQIEQYRQERDDQLRTLEAEAEAHQMTAVDREAKSTEIIQKAEQQVQMVLVQFNVEALELTGTDKFFKIYRVIDPKTRQVVTKVEITHFDGRPYQVEEQEMVLAAAGMEEKTEVLTWKTLPLDPGVVNMGLYEHTAEIPRVLRDNNADDLAGGRINLAARFKGAVREKTGLNMDVWKRRFGEKLRGLLKMYLLGYGSSNRAARIVVPLFERLLTNVLAEAPPVPELLGGFDREFLPDPEHDAAVDISYSGETHGLLAAMHRLMASVKRLFRGVVQVAVCGKPSSSLFRHLSEDVGTGEGGALNILTGPEVTVATVKGIAGQIRKLVALAIQLAQETEVEDPAQQQLIDHLIAELKRLPDLAEQVVPALQPTDTGAYEAALKRREQMKKVANELFGPRLVQQEAGIDKEPSEYDSLVILAGDYTGYEAELKGEEITNVPAYFAHFSQVEKVIGLMHRQMERIKRDPKTRRSLLFIDDTLLSSHAEALASIELFRELAKEVGFKLVVHTSFPKEAALQEAAADPNVRLFSTPKVDDYLQSMLTLVFYDLFSTDLALARGLSYAQANQSKNLTKAVTVGMSSTQEDALKQLRAVLLEIQDYIRANPGVPFNAAHFQRDVLSRFASPQRLETAVARGPLLLLAAAGQINPDGHHIRIGTAEQDAAFRKEILSRFKEGATQLQDIVLLVDSELGASVARGIEYQLRYLLGGVSVRIRSIGEQIKADKERSLVVGITTPGTDRGLTDVLNRLDRAGVATFALTDLSRPSTYLPQATVGTLAYPEQTDSVGLYGVAYTYLEALAVALGIMKGTITNEAEYAQGLSQESVIAGQLYQMDSMFTEMQNVFRSILNDPNVQRLDRLQIIAGRQSYGSAMVLAYYLNIWAGVHAEVLLLDESYHGPLAVVPEVPIVIFGTDDFAFPQALYDAGINKARDGNVTVVLQAGDERSPGVRDVRPNSIIRLPKLPDPLINPIDGLFSQLFALEWAKAIGRVNRLSEQEVSAQLNDPRMEELVRRYEEKVHRLRSQTSQIQNLFVVERERLNGAISYERLIQLPVREGPPVISPPYLLATPIPDSLRSQWPLLERLVERFRTDHTIRFEPMPGPREGQTTLVIIGNQKQTGLLAALTAPIDDVRINIDRHGDYDADTMGLSYVTVDASTADLQKPRTELRGKSVLQSIQERIDTLVRGGMAAAPDWERELDKGLDRLDEEAREWIRELCRAYQQKPQPIVELYDSVTHPEMASIVAVIPFHNPGGGTPIGEIYKAIMDDAERKGLKPDYDTRYFWKGYRGIPDVPEVGLLHISFKKTDVDRVKLIESVTKALEPYVHRLEAGLEEGVPVRQAMKDIQAFVRTHPGAEVSSSGTDRIGTAVTRDLSGADLTGSNIEEAVHIAAQDRVIAWRVRGSRENQVEIQPPSAGGLKEIGVVDWDDLITRLPSALATESSVGVIAGKDPTGLAYGVALSRRATAADGRFIPVAFVVENDAQAATLQAMGFTSGEIFRDVAAAREWLEKDMKVVNVKELGTDGPVTGIMPALLKNLFGIELKPGEIALWQSFVDQVKAVFASQA